MRVLNITLNHADAWGGTTVAVSNFAKALGADVLSFTSEPMLPTARHGLGITHIPVPDSLPGKLYGLPRTGDMRAAWEMAQSYDVLICHMLFRHHTNWVQETGKPYFVVPHGSLDPYVFTYRRLRKELWLNLFGKRYFRGAEAVVFATRRERQKAVHGIGSDNGRVICWPVEEPPRGGPSRDEVRAKLGIPEGDRALLFLGRLHSMKRPVETIEAFVQAAVEGVHLLLAGPDEEFSASELQAVARRSGAKNVHVLGPVYGPAKWGLLRAADGYISLSMRENFGFAMAEAMSMGLPLILSQGNDLGCEVKQEGCSWTVGADIQGDAARAIQAFARSSPDRLHEMGARGRRWILSNANFDRFEERLRALVLNERRLEAMAGGRR